MTCVDMSKHITNDFFLLQNNRKNMFSNQFNSWLYCLALCEFIRVFFFFFFCRCMKLNFVSFFSNWPQSIYTSEFIQNEWKKHNLSPPFFLALFGSHARTHVIPRQQQRRRRHNVNIDVWMWNKHIFMLSAESSVANTCVIDNTPYKVY